MIHIHFDEGQYIIGAIKSRARSSIINKVPNFIHFFSPWRKFTRDAIARDLRDRFSPRIRTRAGNTRLPRTSWHQLFFVFFSTFFFAGCVFGQSPEVLPHRTVTADVVIAGGSTAALAAAFAAAEEGASVVLIEPTDWIGGQLTASGVPAVDEAWHRIKDPTNDRVLLDVSRIARDARNMNPAFRDMLLAIGNPGQGWVSRFCFEPRVILEQHLLPWEKRLADRLTVFRNTVVKRVDCDLERGTVTAIEAVQRVVRNGIGQDGYDLLPSQDLADWYDEDDSARYQKQRLRFEGKVFVEATEWGELLALTGGDYLQGVDTTDGALDGNDTMGQATVFGFVQRLNADETLDPAAPAEVRHLGFGMYEDRKDAWQQIWTYRRLLGHADWPSVGDLSLQNWGYSLRTRTGGNDYPFGYLFLDKHQTADSRSDWQGGVDLKVMAAAEQRALAWHHWFKQHAPEGIHPNRITIAPDVLGTGHGLSKLPYIRDTRRAIGLDGFLLKFDDLVGERGANTGRVFPDTVALGAYPADVHRLANCEYPAHVDDFRETRPFCIPFRALTHNQFGNVFVAGKTMAQTFMANSATRLHPIEWSTGTAAGIAAAWISRNGQSTRDAYGDLNGLRERIARKQPIQWTIE